MRFLLVSWLSSFALAQSPDVTVAVSSDIVTGLFIGFFLIGMLYFVVSMLSDVQPSDTLGKNKD